MSGVALADCRESQCVLQARLRTDGYLFFLETPSTDPRELLEMFGRCRPQDDGSTFYRVRAGDRLQPAGGDLLLPHTDDFNCAGLPPRLAALYCRDPGSAGGGETLIADGYSWLRTLTAAERQCLQRRWPYAREDTVIEQPFLSYAPCGSAAFRVSFGHLRFRACEQMVGIMAALLRWFSLSAVSIRHRRGSLLMWNNWRMIHGRNAYVDLRRELHRYHLD